MKNNFIKYLLIFSIASECSYSQDTNPDNRKISQPYKYFSGKSELIKSESEYSSAQKILSKKRIEKFHFEYHKSKIQQHYSFDLFNSVGSNINFGGIWDKYAVINFTPQISIQPASFLKIYANRFLNCLIPVDGIKGYSASVIIQSALMLAADNALKLMMNSKNNWITDLISFAAKNLLINILIKPDLENSKSPALLYESYYYSTSIIF